MGGEGDCYTSCPGSVYWAWLSGDLDRATWAGAWPVVIPAGTQRPSRGEEPQGGSGASFILLAG